ncbi:hypothetical protein SAMN02745171_00468 [Porphyromonas circumdentaria]|uniref:Uncharacterized protein n=1 Tax=Porphyromonas circumdentaria TaxID=29524 RepID=A0A1T4LPB3_9PORP|nr:hypothetical protein [Porphyromonas circumdentaria]SJZ56466.1 hypothetical protein SAMN02745171_00468 [Porphyromonas circumdentaria]
MRELRFSRRAKKYHNTEMQNIPPEELLCRAFRGLLMFRKLASR